MAHLPPKVPNMTQNWPDFMNSHQKNMPLVDSQNPNSPYWVDEFLDFSSARRGSHRRSISDSIAFLETPMVEECRRSTCIPMQLNGRGNTHNNNNNNNNEDDDNAGGIEFERFDDDQLMCMFTDDVPMGPIATMSCSNPSSPSDHASINDDEKMIIQQVQVQVQVQVQPKNEPEEVQSPCDSEGQNPLLATPGNNSSEKIVDPKRIKRILANRQSAQRSRVRKLQYISELERSVTSLQAEVSVLSPRVAFLDHQRLVLNVDNSVLKQRIAALAQDKVFKDAHQEALKREIERLRQIYYQQNLKKMENSAGQPKSPARAADTNCTAEKEELAVN